MLSSSVSVSSSTDERVYDVSVHATHVSVTSSSSAIFSSVCDTKGLSLRTKAG